MRTIAALTALLVCVGAFGQRMDVVTPKLDKAAVRAEREWQRENAWTGPEVVSPEWNWLTMTQADLLAHAIPLLRANVDLCGGRTILIPAPEGEPVEICNYLPFLTPNPYPNAFTDGYTVFFTSGMLRSFKNSDEFRAVLGHELAHILGGHLQKQTTRNLIFSLITLGVSTWGNTEIGSFWDLAGPFATMKFNRKYELEADYIGAYLSARSGGDVNAASEMWRRWGEGRGGSFLDSHPSDSKRFVNLRAAAAEIAEKREKGLRILPNMKPPRPMGAAHSCIEFKRVDPSSSEIRAHNKCNQTVRVAYCLNYGGEKRNREDVYCGSGRMDTCVAGPDKACVGKTALTEGDNYTWGACRGKIALHGGVGGEPPAVNFNPTRFQCPSG